MAKRDDNFTADIIRATALRAAYHCSKPDCRKLTVEPHSDPSKPLISGEAAHICAAAKNGARYGDCESSTQRKSIANAIWLCSSCHTIVDKDEARYPAKLLRQWKQRHETWVRDQRAIGFALPKSRWFPDDEFSLARKLIKYLEDKRALYAPFELELPELVSRSVFDIRSKLTKVAEKSEDGTILSKAVSNLRAGCRKFFTATQSADAGTPNYPTDRQKFFYALGELRGIVGVQLAYISASYGINIDSDLASILPDLPEQSTGKKSLPNQRH